MTDRKFDRIADAFLAPGPTVVPDRVLDAAFEEVHLTRQRRAHWRAPWRFATMNTYAKVAAAAVAVIAVGLLGLNFLGSDRSGVGAAPSAVPPATAAPTATPVPSSSPSPVPTAPPLTGQFTSGTHGFSISYPGTWVTRAATAPWRSGFVDFTQESGDILYDASIPANLFLAIASQPLADRTPAEFEADIWRMLVDDDPVSDCAVTAVPITIDGAAGAICSNVAVVTDGGRGYFVLSYTSGDQAWINEVHDQAWFESVLATMTLHPEDAVDAVLSPEPALTGQFTSERHGYSISYPEAWSSRPATTAWTTGVVDYFNDGADLLMPGDPGNPFLAIASQPLGGRTREEWEADVWQILIDDDPGTAACQSAAEPITIDGAPGIRGCNSVLVTDGGRGYLVMLWVSDDGPGPGEYDQAWLESVLATMKLEPENAVD